MKPRLFILGPSGCGKSTAIRLELGDRFRRAGGFTTCRDRDENGKVSSFVIQSADGYGPRDRFLDLKAEPPRIDLELFDRVGVDYLRRAGERPFAVLDELGGVELLDDGFVRALAQFLKSDTPCIGVLKGPGTGRTVGVMGLNLRYELARRVLLEHLLKDADVMVVRTSGLGDEKAEALVQEWVDEYAK